MPYNPYRSRDVRPTVLGTLSDAMCTSYRQASASAPRRRTSKICVVLPPAASSMPGLPSTASLRRTSHPALPSRRSTSSPLTKQVDEARARSRKAKMQTDARRGARRAASVATNGSTSSSSHAHSAASTISAAKTSTGRRCASRGSSQSSAWAAAEPLPTALSEPVQLGQPPPAATFVRTLGASDSSVIEATSVMSTCPPAAAAARPSMPVPAPSSSTRRPRTSSRSHESRSRRSSSTSAHDPSQMSRAVDAATVKSA
mmetsp:Transcript_26680/g.89998  ORF Transcript_26680/g.89998 Transcript_26680/m.89998 type:complete len:258 (+) Transcript_26680:46-819(+)